MGGFKAYIRGVEKKSPIVAPHEHEWPFEGSSLRQAEIAYAIERLIFFGRGLMSAFTWSDTPQGYHYWSEQNQEGLDEESVGILMSWLEDYRG